ncbi:MAG: sigma-70 family RNA polymerase sigma factor [Zavarzinella sp.]
MDAHERFLRHYASNEPAIRGYVRRLLPNREDVHDVMQDVALVLWKKFEELPNESDFRPWAFGVAKLQTLAWLRDKARDRLKLSEETLLLLADESTPVQPLLEQHQEELEHCLEKLPAEEKLLLLAAYQPQAKINIVAQQSNRTVGAFYKWLHRTRMKLLACIQQRVEWSEAK